MWAELLTSTYLNIETSPRQAIVLIMSRSKRYHYQCRSAGITAHSHSSDSTSLEKNTSRFILWIKSSSVIHSFISSTYPHKSSLSHLCGLMTSAGLWIYACWIFLCISTHLMRSFSVLTLASFDLKSTNGGNQRLA